MDQEVDIQRLEQLEKYTFLEFAVSPKLFREYVIHSLTSDIIAR
jgi:hypothetical protein